jgi:hypothetical protein
VSRPEERDPERMCFSKVGFIAFIAMVINCTALMQRKSHKIDVVVAAAEKYFGVRDFNLDLQGVLRGGAILPGRQPSVGSFRAKVAG